MNLITRQILANHSAERFFRAQVQMFGSSSTLNRKTRGEIHGQLLALGAFPNPDDVDKIIGNDSWTAITCSHCKKEVDRAISLDVTGGEYATELCASCIEKAMKLIENK